MNLTHYTVGLLAAAAWGVAASGAAQAPSTRPLDVGRRVFIDVNRVAPVEVLK